MTTTQAPIVHDISIGRSLYTRGWGEYEVAHMYLPQHPDGTAVYTAIAPDGDVRPVLEAMYQSDDDGERLSYHWPATSECTIHHLRDADEQDKQLIAAAREAIAAYRSELAGGVS